VRRLENELGVGGPWRLVVFALIRNTAISSCRKIQVLLQSCWLHDPLYLAPALLTRDRLPFLIMGVLARYDINGSKYVQRENRVLLVQGGSKERKTVWFECLGILVSWAVGVSETNPALGCSAWMFGSAVVKAWIQSIGPVPMNRFSGYLSVSIG
jgi:hypothetical protein